MMHSYPVTVTHLHIHPPFRPLPKQAWPQGISFTKEVDISVPLYRELYHNIGYQWHWTNRRFLNDEQLSSLIHHPQTEIYILRADDMPIGFVETNAQQHPIIEITFVGLLNDYIGKGYGYKMLTDTLSRLYTRSPQQIIIQTCTEDHPRALMLYQQIGFQIHKRESAVIEDDH